MYGSCIFCSAALGSNESIERFPVGRSLAFDAAKGRLWAVCPKCARWNLAPIEERWEAIEDAERLFRGTRTRVQSENIGLAKLRDGTRLVRVGEALAGELAAWRYGRQLVKRKRRALWYGPAVAAGGLVVYVGAGLAFPVIGMVGSSVLFEVYKHLVEAAPGKRVVGRVDAEVEGVRTTARLRAAHMKGAWLSDPDDGCGIALNVHQDVQVPHPRLRGHTLDVSLVLRGDTALGVLGRGMVQVNARGASPGEVRMALQRMQRVGSPGEFVREFARQELMLTGEATRQPGQAPRRKFGRSQAPGGDRMLALALEMALHEDTERRVLEGELAMLEGMWRDAEAIAGIADRLPDVPAPEPPRLVKG
ncbi:MAG TPA: hypothetical protein VGC13_31615 [Longimicrobium sp.]|jgi:hypothetical protein|uniref:hypothetical protein n=1 Tax=Longimicrobium sp. TaxID=2029185 RepID=UPI002EDA42C4